MNLFDSSRERMAFMIIHKGPESVFVPLNTWIGNNMIQTHIYITNDGGVPLKNIR